MKGTLRNEKNTRDIWDNFKNNNSYVRGIIGGDRGFTKMLLNIANHSKFHENQNQQIQVQ